MNIIVKNIPIWDSKKREHVRVDVDLEVSEYILAASMARKAADNRWGQSTIAGGAVKVTIRGWLGRNLLEKNDATES